MNNNVDNNPQNSGDVEYIKIENITFRVTSFYNKNTSLHDIIKSGLKREADTVLRQIGKK
jgi:hypothetical protein